MKNLAALLLLASFAHGQTDVSVLLGKAMRDAAASHQPIPQAEQKQVTTLAAELLAKHVTIRPDGSASAVYQRSGNWYVEWRGFTIRRVDRAPVSDADRLNGITKRYHVVIGAEAHRDWPPKGQGWSEWRSGGFILFPSAIVVEETNGTWRATGNSRLPVFMPGSGSATVQRPASTEPGLPAGMTRRK